MSTIPTSDAALLAAQAKAGQAGVDAYEAARAEMERQRTASVQTAMQEAALRGAPAGAVTGTAAAAPYEQRIASLTQGQGAYQAELASRERRLADYNAAVLSRRGLLSRAGQPGSGPVPAAAALQVASIGGARRARG